MTTPELTTEADVFAAHRASITRALAALAALVASELGGVRGPVADAIRYSLLGEGKRMRAILFLSAFEAAGGEGDASALATAIEVVHAYSLVHDDLPCMDDDDVRRGRPTVHRVHGVAAATAAGLAMVPLAARCAAAGCRALALPAVEQGHVVRTLMRASGPGGMIGGQLLDLEGEGRPLELADLERIHRAKTGALIVAAAILGGRAARCDADCLRALQHYGEAVGLAFQIADDVLDLTATTDQLGKTAGRDLALGKSTYPALLGIHGATERAQQLVQDACATLAAVGLDTPALVGIARFTVERTS